MSSTSVSSSVGVGVGVGVGIGIGVDMSAMRAVDKDSLRDTVIQVYRCGNNYRLVGQDTGSNALYECFCYSAEVEIHLADHNSSLPTHTIAQRHLLVRLWQHERVSEVLLSRLRLIPRLIPLTRELGANKIDTMLELVLLPSASLSTRCLTNTTHQQRTLWDQQGIMVQYNKLLQKASKVALAAAVRNAVAKTGKGKNFQPRNKK